MKNRILIFSTSYLPYVGGAELAIKNITDRLPPFQFDLVTARFSRKNPSFERIGAVNVHRVGLGSRLDSYLYLFFGLLKGFTLAKNSSLLWGMDISQGSLVAATIKFFRGHTPLLFTIQYGYGEDRVASGRGGLINLAFRFILRRASCVTVISKSLEELARKYGYKGQIQIVPNGVDISKFKTQNSELKTGNRVAEIITVSRLVFKNGIDILIEAISKLKIQNLQLKIIGIGPQASQLKNLVRDLQISDRVQFLGNVTQEQLPSYLQSADIFVRPSRSEGLGTAFLEAMAAGLPVIATRVGGIPDFVIDGQTGLFCSEKPEDLAEKITTLIKDQGLRERIADGGRKLVLEKYDWKTIVEDMAKIFDKLTV